VRDGIDCGIDQSHTGGAAAELGCAGLWSLAQERGIIDAASERERQE